MDTTATGTVDTASPGVIIHAQRADQLVRLASSEERVGADRAATGPAPRGSAVR
jgi:hypothetical protein